MKVMQSDYEKTLESKARAQQLSKSLGMDKKEEPKRWNRGDVKEDHFGMKYEQEKYNKLVQDTMNNIMMTKGLEIKPMAADNEKQRQHKSLENYKSDLTGSGQKNMYMNQYSFKNLGNNGQERQGSFIQRLIRGQLDGSR